jgi:hypothetical protein
MRYRMPNPGLPLPSFRIERTLLMKFQLGSMTTGEILDRGLKVLFRRLGTFYLVTLILTSPLLAYQCLVVLAEFTDTAAIVTGLLAIILYFVFVFVATGAIIYIIAQEHIGSPVGTGQAMSYAFRRFGDLFVTSFLVGIVMMVGFMLLIIPGIIFALWYSLSTQVVMLENCGGTKAMARSKQLTEGFRGRIFGLLVLTGILGGVVVYLINLGLMNILPISETIQTDRFAFTKINKPNYLIIQVVDFLVQTLFSTYTSICLTLAYFDLRVRKEAFDLELVARSNMPSGAGE